MKLFRVAVALSLLFATATLSATAESLSADDIAKIRDAHKRYETTWLKGDADGVRSLFTDDCVLLPHHGDPPRVGKKEMNYVGFAGDIIFWLISAKIWFLLLRKYGTTKS